MNFWIVVRGSPFFGNCSNLHFYLNYIYQIFNIDHVAEEHNSKSDVKKSRFFWFYYLNSYGVILLSHFYEPQYTIGLNVILIPNLFF